MHRPFHSKFINIIIYGFVYLVIYFVYNFLLVKNEF